MSREQEIEASLSVMRSTLETIARRNDCDYCMDPPKDRPRPCPCSKCIATAALHVADNWRYLGARHERVKYMPRERKIMDAWKQEVGDFRLGQILAEERFEDPTPRDWFVASSVVQWLATNVGMEVLRKAGFEYRQHEEDRKEMDSKREEADRG